MSVSGRQRSVVVLAGWLGCKAKALQKYEALYERLLGVGRVTVHSRIAPPAWIVQTCLDQPENMDEMARHLIREVAVSMKTTREGSDPMSLPGEPINVYFHAFSNAGCILWERFRHQLLSKYESQSSIRPLLNINGVIFDSCPIVDLSLIRNALEHCDWRERAEVIRVCGGLDYTQPENLRVFADRFQRTLREDLMPIPQLYLYSRNDPLTPYKFIKELVQYRRQLLPTRYIEEFSWDESPHCAHLLWHPETYEQALEGFLLRASSR